MAAAVAAAVEALEQSLPKELVVVTEVAAVRSSP
jgi:hypothetical protein